jgi:hypothetical protein
MPRRWLFRGALVLAVLVHVPALFAPFMLDDHDQAAMLEGRYGPGRAPFNLYDYVDDANRASLFERGFLPWWTDPHLVVRFWRPLASFLIWADYRAFGLHPFWHHLHSLAWWVVAVLGVHALLKRCFRPRSVLFGTIAFALAPAHAIPLVYVANREALVSAALGVWALVAYTRWREAHRPRDGLTAFVVFALAMLAGEYSLCLAGYVVAVELFKRREPLARRAVGLAAFVVPAAAYFAAHVGLGYGAHGAGFYRNPFHDFASYARVAPRRLAILVGSAWLGVDESWTEASSWGIVLLVAATIGVVSVPLVRALRDTNEDERRNALWMLVGSVLALAPVAAVQASTRVLVVSMIGVCGVAGVVVDRTWFPDAPQPRRGLAELAGLAALALGFAQFVRAPFETMAIVRAASTAAESYAARLDWLRAHLDPGARPTVVVLRGDSSEMLLAGPMLLRDKAPDRWRMLAFHSGRMLLLRTGERTIELVQSERPLFHVGPDDLFRTAGSLAPGDSVEVPGMKATLLQADDHGAPKRVRFELDRDLDDPSLQWLTEGRDGFREERPPPVGYGAPVMP